MASVDVLEAARFEPVPFRARLVPANEGAREIRRIGTLTDESVRALLDDARLAGRGARLEIRLTESARPMSRWLGEVAKLFHRRGIAVAVRTEPALPHVALPAARAA